MVTLKEERIHPEEVKSLLSYDASTGNLTWSSRDGNVGFNARYAGRRAFTNVERKGYHTGCIKGIHFKAHRVAWCIHYGHWPDGQIDHINGDKSDNRICNLRTVDNKTNCRSKGMNSRNTSGYTGVSFSKRMNTWVAKYRKDLVDHHVGYFNCPTAAGLAVMLARINDGFDERHGIKWDHEASHKWYGAGDNIG